MNNALHDLYSSKWEELTKALEEIDKDESLETKPANPLLLYVDNEEEYKQADLRIMMFGQETNGWYQKEQASIDDLQDCYDDFFNKGECWRYGGQFWNGVKRFFPL